MQVLHKLTRIILTYCQLQPKRTDLEAQIAAIQAQGDVIVSRIHTIVSLTLSSEQNAPLTADG